MSAQTQAEMNRLARQFLLHSFLYYRLQAPLISDAQFDGVSQRLYALHQRYPNAPLPFADHRWQSAIGRESSGYSIRQYPPQVITLAFKLLYGLQEGEKTQASATSQALVREGKGGGKREGRREEGLSFEVFVQRKGWELHHPSAP